jgi:hypothetical protein
MNFGLTFCETAMTAYRLLRQKSEPSLSRTVKRFAR